MDPDIIVFTKPWPELEPTELVAVAKNLDVDGIELPVRPGFQVTPEQAETKLPEAARILADNGLKIESVAGSAEERIVVACAKAQVPLIRIMVRIPPERGYFDVIDETRATLDSLESTLRDAGVVIGIQNHCDRFIGSAIGLYQLVEPLASDTVGIILDPAHCALDGEPIDMAIDITRDRLSLVNLKGAFKRRINGVNSVEARWRTEWCTARDAGYSWSETIGLLRNAGYEGPLCLPVEYSDPETGKLMEGDAVLTHLRYDRAYLADLLSNDRSGGTERTVLRND